MESMGHSQQKSDAVVVPVGEKRPADNSEDREFNVHSKKKKKAIGSRDLKRVAEIVLVLSAMAEMRGARSPTEIEAEMMAEARAKVADVCLGFAPEDIVSREAIKDLIEDLGLKNEAMDQKIGFVPLPKKSIAERLLLTKQRMEESKKFSSDFDTFSSQRLQTRFGTAAENHGTSNTVHMFPSYTSNRFPREASQQPQTHVSTATFTSLPHQLPTNNVTSSMVSSILPSSHLGKDPSSLALPGVERAHFKLDGGARLVQASSSANHPLLNAKSTSLVKSGPESKLPNQTLTKVDVTMSRTATQSRNLPTIHQPLQGMKFPQAPRLRNNHDEIAKMVHKFLQSQLPEHPKLNPPSRDYMNKACTCQVCKRTIDDVDSVLLCDGCDEGFHVKCLASYNQKRNPRNEWYCLKCLRLSNGKPFPSQYHLVKRNINAPKAPPYLTRVHSSSLKITTNGSSSLQNPPHVSESAADSNILNAREMQGKRNSGLPVASAIEISSTQCVDITASLPREVKSIPDSNSQPPAKFSDPAQALDSSHDVEVAEVSQVRESCEAEKSQVPKDQMVSPTGSMIIEQSLHLQEKKVEKRLVENDTTRNGEGDVTRNGEGDEQHVFKHMSNGVYSSLGSEIKEGFSMEKVDEVDRKDIVIKSASSRRQSERLRKKEAVNG